VFCYLYYFDAALALSPTSLARDPANDGVPVYQLLLVFLFLLTFWLLTGAPVVVGLLVVVCIHLVDILLLLA
jgi:hypothetical protein